MGRRVGERHLVARKVPSICTPSTIFAPSSLGELRTIIASATSEVAVDAGVLLDLLICSTAVSSAGPWPRASARARDLNEVGVHRSREQLLQFLMLDAARRVGLEIL